ncbi:MAG: hypothetical protein JHC41_04360 [Nitrosopumilus sp.]|nr:hypothetical protein [Nitrosopumilus sp.]
MQYKIHLLVISAIIIASFSFYNAYASGPLSFDQTRIVLEHGGIISCIGCTDVGNTITVTLNGGTGAAPPNTKTITLNKVVGSSPLTYQSNFIKFYDCPATCGTYEYDVKVNDVITATASGYTVTPAATIFATGDLSDPAYVKTAKTITPNKSVTNTCSSYGADTDGDNICDFWENNSNYPSPCPSSGPGLCIRTSATVTPYFIGCTPGATDFRNICPSPTKADTYFEIDWMMGHKPSDDVISAVADTFRNSNYVSKNSVNGINFHVQLDEELPHVDLLPFSSSGVTASQGYDQLKYWWFGNSTERTYSFPNENTNSPWYTSMRSQKGQVFHYTIFAHQQAGISNLNSSGIAEMPGNDAVITLGAFDGKVGSKEYQKAALLHEIGHNLGLDHGGNSAINCKPNYLSVMNYAFEFPIFVSNRPLDFSRSLLPTLTETSLDENVGVGASNGLKTAYGPLSVLNTTTGISVNWNRDTNPADATDVGVNADINNFGITNCLQSANQTLTGFKDWNSSMKLSSLGILGAGAEAETYPDGMDPSLVVVESSVTEFLNQSGTIPKTPEPKSTPLHQYKIGISPADIKCMDELNEKLTPPNKEFGGCFTPENVIDMEKRGWVHI